MSAVKNDILLLTVVGVPVTVGGALLVGSLVTGDAGLRTAAYALLGVPFALAAALALAAAVEALSGRADRSLDTHDTATGKRVARRRREPWMEEAAVAPDGSRLVRLDRDLHTGVLRVEVRALPDGAVLASRELPRRMAGAVAISADRATIAVRTWEAGPSGGFVQHVMILDGATLEERATRIEEAEMYSLALSADGSRLLISGERSGLMLHDAHTLERIAAHPDLATAGAFSPDGERIVVGVQGGLMVRDARSLRLIWTACGEHQGVVERTCWSADGRRIAIASSDRITIWDGSGTLPILRTIEHRRGRALYLALAPDGSRVTSG
jgi:hypothetical protein